MGFHKYEGRTLGSARSRCNQIQHAAPWRAAGGTQTAKRMGCEPAHQTRSLIPGVSRISSLGGLCPVLAVYLPPGSFPTLDQPFNHAPGIWAPLLSHQLRLRQRTHSGQIDPSDVTNATVWNLITVIKHAFENSALSQSADMLPSRNKHGLTRLTEEASPHCPRSR